MHNWIYKSQKKGPFKYSLLAIALLTASSFVLYVQLMRLGYIFPLSQIIEIFCLKGCQAQTSLHGDGPGDLFNYKRPLEEAISASEIDKTKVSILIEKSYYRLTVYYDGEAVKSYPVVFGGNPVGDKYREGDRRTPEGLFKVRDLYPHDSWSKFIWLDYPTQESWRKHLQAKREGTINWGDSIGGEIGIHGVPNNSDYLIDKRQNWTLGCIALKNKDVDEIYRVLQQNTLVEIVP